MKIVTRVEGLEGLERRMRSLQEAVAARGAFRAVRRAMERVRRRAIANVQAMFKRDTGTLENGIVVVTEAGLQTEKGRVSGRGGKARAFVTILKDAFYGLFLHQGWQHIGRGKTRRRQLRRIRRSRGGAGPLANAPLPGRFIPGKRFLSEALEQEQAGVEQDLTDELKAILESFGK